MLKYLITVSGCFGYLELYHAPLPGLGLPKKSRNEWFKVIGSFQNKI